MPIFQQAPYRPSIQSVNMNGGFLQQPPQLLARSPSPGPPPVPPMMFQKEAILSSMTNQPIFTVNAERSMFSGKRSKFNLQRHWTGQPMGSFRISGMDPSKIEFDVNGAPNLLKEASVWSSSKWLFQPTSFPGRQWQWKRNGEEFTLTDDAETQIATVINGNLVVQPLGFGNMAVDEVVLTGYAMWQKRRNDKGEGKQAEAAADVISALTGA